MIVEAARAKVNLALHVVGRRADGFHDLDSIVVFADIGDRLTLTPAEDWSLDVEGPFAGSLDASPENLALRAALALERLLPGRIGPARLKLEKNLPVASGIGGGSADAAAVIRGLLALAGIALQAVALDPLAVQLGADVPVCLYGKACRMSGMGERLANLEDVPGMPAVLVNPGVPISTAQVFGRLALAPGQAAFAPIPPRQDDFLSWLAACRNDLEGPAEELVPAVRMALRELMEAKDCRLARMSGSGATCFGIFTGRQAADSAAQAFRARGWWAEPTVLG
jgi:4-diphosphocytidyl-2-C-methyl-D-erythritol kinase